MRGVSSVSARTCHLLSALTRLFSRYVEFGSESQPLTLALWVLHTWTFDAAYVTPYIHVTSPEMRAGKSRVMYLSSLFVARPLKTEGITPAALFRGAHDRTLLLDEIDTIFSGKTDREDLRAVINAGFERGATILRCAGKDHEVAEFPVFSPKALAGIDNRRFPRTIADRSIEIRLQRRVGGNGERLRKRRTEAEAAPLRGEIAAWAEVAVELLRDADPPLPDQLNDRAQDMWESLIAIADLAGNEYPARARRAAVELSADAEAEDGSLAVRCLADIRSVFDSAATETIFTRDLIAGLRAIEESPWSGLRDGRGLGAHLLGELLRPFGIKPRSVRVGAETAKGYRREQFEDAWRRYLPHSPDHRSHRHNPLAEPGSASIQGSRLQVGSGADSQSASRSGDVTLDAGGQGNRDAGIERS